jgi:biopolymer transport protein ExbB
MIEFGFEHFVRQLDPLGWVLMAVLALLSLASWTFFLVWLGRGALEFGRSRRYVAEVLAAPALAARAPPARGAGAEAGLLDLVCAGRALADAGYPFAEAGGLAAHLTRGLRQQLDRAAVAAERGLALLATTAATAPYLGLLGTVWGIYHALLRIAATGEAGLAAVAGPIGEALVMTALGLSVAIPAVLAHNLIQRRNRLRQAHLEDFAASLLLRATAPETAAHVDAERAAPLRRLGG